MAVRPVGQPVVDLVAVDEQVVADGDVGDGVLDVVGQDGAGRVARVAEEQGLRPRRDRGLDGRRVEREVVLEAGRDVADDAAGEDDGRDVGDVRGLVEDHLVARVAGRPQREVDGLRGADRDQQLRRRVVGDAVAPLEVRGERAPQLDRAVVARVVGPAVVERADAGGDDPLGRVEVGLPHPEADDVVHRREDVEEAADSRRRDGEHALGEGSIGERWSCCLGRHRRAPAIAPARSAGVGAPGSLACASWAGSSARQSAPDVSAS